MPHKLDDNTLVTADTLRWAIRRASEDGGDGRHFLIMQKSDGGFLHHNPGSPDPDQLMVVYTHEIVTRLNNEIAHDGAWFAILSHPHPIIGPTGLAHDYQRITAAWMDKDGDAHFPFTWEAGTSEEVDFADLLANGTESWIDLAEAAYQTWDTLAREVIDAAAGQTFAKAAGEIAPSTRL